MWYKGQFFKYATGTIMVLLIIFLLYKIGFVFTPIIDFIATLFFPILLAGVLYFVLRPLVMLVERLNIPRWLAILIVYFIILIIVILFIGYLGPVVLNQISIFTNEPAAKFNIVKEKTIDIANVLHINLFSPEDIKNFLTTFLYKINTLISENIVTAVTTLTKFTVLLFITPFILYYFLKDDKKLFEWFLRSTPARYHRETETIMKDIDITLSTFVTGQLLVAAVNGLLLLTGYLIIGLDYAVTLSIFAAFFFTIPIVGSVIAIIPALLVGLSDGPWMTFKVVMVLLTVLLLESNLLSPQIMSKRLNIHPLTLMLILLASGSLYGVLGLFLATPVYALVKVITGDIYKMYIEREKKAELLESSMKE